MVFMIGFWRRILSLLKEKNMSQSDLCRETGFTTGTMTTWIKNDRYPTVDKAVVIAKILNTSVETLVFGSNDESEIRDRFQRWIDSMTDEEMETIENLFHVFEKIGDGLKG